MFLTLALLGILVILSRTNFVKFQVFQLQPFKCESINKILVDDYLLSSQLAPGLLRTLGNIWPNQDYLAG